MKMEVLPSDRENLEKLLNDFGSVVSLPDIASAYCQSGRDLYAAGEILCDLQSSTSKASSSTPGEELESADTSPSDDSLEKANYIKSKPRKAPASMGTVSGVIGRDYVRPRPSTNESWKPKPLKLNSNDIPMSEIWDEKDSSDSMRKSETLHKEIEEFLFKRLGDGFCLERSVIQEIVGEILCDLQSSTSKASSSTPGEELESADTSPSDDSLEKANYIKSKPRKAPASMGTVSGVIGRDYVRPRPSTNESWKPKPLKLNSNDIPMSEIWDEKDSSDSMRKSETLHKDIEEFLFKMLGDGFCLERSVIQEIVGEILCDLQSSTSKASSSTPGEELESADTSPSDDSLEKANYIKSKPRKAPASMGTVSGVIGRDYVRPRPSTNESWKPKPLKLNSNDIPMSEIWDEKDSSDSMRKSETLYKDIEEFLFKMLGDGFCLERSVIQEIVGQCGYDVKMSMEKLLDLSASTLGKSDDILKVASEIPTKNCLDLECKQQDDQFPDTGSSGSSTYTLKNEHTLEYRNKEENYDLSEDALGAMSTVPERSEKVQEKSLPVREVRQPRAFGQLVKEPPKETTIKHQRAIKNLSLLPNGRKVSDFQKEVLNALFTIGGRSHQETEKSRPDRGVRRPRAFGQLVEEPLKETTIEHRRVITGKQTMKNDDEENGADYEVLRKAVMEYWFTMKEYYRSAVDAFAKQDHKRAQKLLKEGHFFMEKAREADEKSAQKLLERNDEEEMLVDVHDFEPKEALRILKVQLNSLSGISSFKHLKVLAGSNDEKKNHGRRKRMIIKLLDRENIRWTPEGDGWTIVIPLAEIDPKKLSFTRG